jgi:hypothetical protein
MLSPRTKGCVFIAESVYIDAFMTDVNPVCILFGTDYWIFARAHRIGLQCPAYSLLTSNVVHYNNTVMPRLTKIIRSGITFVSRNVISRRFL